MKYICAISLALLSFLPATYVTAAPMGDSMAPSTPATLPPIKTVTNGDHGQFMVNGAPFFPILLYDAPTDSATLAKLHAMGFNVVTTPKAEDAAALPAQGFYGALHVSAKVPDLSGVLLGLGVDSPALSYPKDTIKTTTAENAKAAANAPGRPIANAIGYWDNEPAGVKAGTLLTKEKYDDLVKAIDVAAPYLYPVPYQPVSTVGDAVARAKAATGGQKPVLPILQTFTWDKADRYPTPQELCCMVCLSIVEGANGVGYYSYGAVTGEPKKTIAEVQPALWESVKATNRTAASIGSFFMAAKPAMGVEAAAKDPAIRVRAGTDATGHMMLVVVNTSDKPVTVTVKGVPSKADPAQSESVSLKLAPFDVHVEMRRSAH